MQSIDPVAHGNSCWLRMLATAMLGIAALAACKGPGSPYADSPEFGACMPAPGATAPQVALTYAESSVDDEGQVDDYCGNAAPMLDLDATDPFASERYLPPDDDFVPPFAACEAALESVMASRADCGQATPSALLVSHLAEQDPRWSTGSFDAVFTTIQGAVDSAEHCDQITVRPGVYREYVRIEGKDVRIVSDSWDEAGTANDGDQRVTFTAERIDLRHYYDTGERTVLEQRNTFRRPLARAVRTIIEGGGYAEGPTLGGQLADSHDPASPNRGCGNRRPMVDFVAGTTRNTLLDGFTVRLMPEQDHTIPGHGHTLQCRGGSPIIRNNIVYNNGSTGAGIHASFAETTPVTPPCEAEPELAQQTFTTSDYRARNIQYRPAPLVYGNISYQNNGLGLGNNHYSCAAIIDNESFWNAVPGEEAEHQSPGIGTRHGAKTYISRNIVYENAWTGIAVHQGVLQPSAECATDPVACNHIDERTQAVITDNIVFDNGHPDAPEGSQAGIAVDGAGLPDEPVLIEHNVSYGSRTAGIGVRNEYAGAQRGYVLDDTYAVISANTVVRSGMEGISCLGSDYGTTHCTTVGNNSLWNQRSGIGFADRASGSALHNVAACNGLNGLQTVATSDGSTIALYNNIAWANVLAGIAAPDSSSDYNILSANNGQEPTCSDRSIGKQCTAPQVGQDVGGSAGSNDLFVDPGFCEATSFDFGLREGSWALDSGADISDYYTGWSAAGAGPDRGSTER